MISVDAQTGYEEWVHAYLADVDTIPALLVTLVEMATPSISASRTDTIRVSGSKREDYTLIEDTGAHWELDRLWSTLTAYVRAVSDHTVTWAPWPLINPTTRPTRPDDARRIGYTITGWLAEHVEHIVDWIDLGPLEQALQGELHSGRARYLAKWRPRRETPTLCTTCGEQAVRLEWGIGPAGATTRERVCSTCAERYGLAPTPRRWIGSEECFQGDHPACMSLNCDCQCHLGEAS